MSVTIKGQKWLDKNYFDKITIRELESDDVVVDISKRDKRDIDTEKSEVKFSRKISGMDSHNQVLEIVKRYLDDFKVNGIDISFSKNKKRMVLTCFGDNFNEVLELKINTSNCKDYEDIINLIKVKYLEDRYRYFWNEDIKNIFLSNDILATYYRKDCKDTGVNDIYNIETYNILTLNNRSSQFKEPDTLFIYEYLKYKLWEYGKNVDYWLEEMNDIGFMNEENIQSGLIYKIMIGDMKIYVPVYCEYVFDIIEIIDEYNEEISRINEFSKKKQLKMEGF